MRKYDFDLFVIGAGSGGVRAARMSGGYGAKVAIAERLHIGGTCVNVGCVPKKMFVHASHFSDDFNDAEGYGWQTGERIFDWQQLIKNKNRQIKRLNGIYERLLQESGVELVHGSARLIDPHTIEINNRRFTAGHILVATGARPTIPDIPGKESAITSNEAFFLETLPESITIAGGGYIGAEFAGIFNGLGVNTTLIYRGSLILSGFDVEAREFLSAEMGKKGINLILNSTIKQIDKNKKKLTVTLHNEDQYQTDMVMFATGRTPDTSSLGLDNAGVHTDDDGRIVVDTQFRTSVPSVYAIGDVTNRLNLTPVAIAEGAAFARSVFDNQPAGMDYDNIPTCVFSQPELASVGLSVEQAIQQYGDISVYKSEFTPLKHTLTGNGVRNLVKLVVDKVTDRVVGAHMVGEGAGEIIQGIAIAVKAGATRAHFDATIGIHPTAAEEFVTAKQGSDTI